MAGAVKNPLPSRRGEPVWELALLYPPQGLWDEGDYLGLDTNQLIEFTGGNLEFLPMPTDEHQTIVDRLVDMLKAYIAKHGAGLVRYAPMRLKVAEGKYREPDIMYLHDADDPRRRNDAWTGADAVFEVVSEGGENRRRDIELKPALYAAAGIPEYWIVDPELREIRVLALAGHSYVEHSVARPDQVAESRLLTGFSAAAADLFRNIKR